MAPCKDRSEDDTVGGKTGHTSFLVALIKGRTKAEVMVSGALREIADTTHESMRIRRYQEGTLENEHVIYT